MRRVVSLAVALALSGCATYHFPQGPKPQVPKGIGSTDWGTVVAIPQGHLVFVTLDGSVIRPGYKWYADEATLGIRDLDGLQTMPRAAIVRVVERVQIGTKRPWWYWYVGIPITTAILGGLTGIVVGAVIKNLKVRQVSAWTLYGGFLTGFAFGLQDFPRPVFEDRLVYVRP